MEEQKIESTEPFSISIDPNEVGSFETILGQTNPKNPGGSRKIIKSLFDGKGTSAMFVSKKWSGIILKDGTYVNWEDIEKAILDAMKKIEPGSMIVNKKGESLNESAIEEIRRSVVKSSGAIIMDGINPHKKFNDSETRVAANRRIITAEFEEEIKAGVVLSSGKIPKLRDGTYVNIDEVRKLIEGFGIKKSVVTRGPVEAPKTVRVTRKYKSIFGYIMAATAIITFLLSFYKHKEKIDKKAVITEAKDRLGVEATKIIEENVMSLEDYYNSVIADLEVGNKVDVHEGDTFYNAARYDKNIDAGKVIVGKTVGKEFNQENKFVGGYQITGFAIVADGKLVDYIQDFDGEMYGPRLEDYVKDVCQNKNLNMNNISVRVHLGKNEDLTRLGWIDVTDLIRKEHINEEDIEKIELQGTTYNGYVDDFKGEYVKLPNGLIIKIYDENGNLLKPGSRIIDDKGEQYIINELSLEQYTTSEEITTSCEKLKIKVSPLMMSLAAASAATSIAAFIMTARKNKKEELNPTFIEFENDKDYQEFLRKFKEEKEKYDKTSKFGRLIRKVFKTKDREAVNDGEITLKERLKRVFIERRKDILRELTEEQVTELYREILNHAGKDYPFGHNDSLEINKGKILIYYHDGGVMDITDIVMPDIHHIGKNNSPVEEGMLSEDYGRKQ